MMVPPVMTILRPTFQQKHPWPMALPWSAEMGVTTPPLKRRLPAQTLEWTGVPELAPKPLPGRRSLSLASGNR